MKYPTLPAFGRLAIVAFVLGLAGCTAMSGLYGPRKAERSSSVVGFLYPGKNEPLVIPGVPVLRLPLRVAVAFVPGKGEGRADFSEAQKAELLKKVAAEFKAYPFIESIQIVPAGYLRPGGGFDNLDQVRGLLGVDIVALLAYDQIQFTDENRLSLAYWTIVGAYFFHGNKNDTHTLMEAVVYDVPSRKLLFRAPGVNLTQANSTFVGLQDRLRTDSVKSFDAATLDLAKNLKGELEAFRERLKRAPEEARIEHKPGYSGGGAVEGWWAGVVLVLLGVGWRWRRG